MDKFRRGAVRERKKIQHNIHTFLSNKKLPRLTESGSCFTDDSGDYLISVELSQKSCHQKFACIWGPCMCEQDS